MNLRVPMIDLAARHRAAADAVEAAALQVLRSGRYVGGPEVENLEVSLAQQMGRHHGIAVSSGSMALELALHGIGVGAGDEVVVPAVTFFATAGAVVRCGAVPVVVDVLPDRPLMDPDAAMAAVTDRTMAVVPVHLFGSAAPTADWGAPIVDDGAQAVGAVPACALGQATAVSFYPTKVLGAAGEGGAIVTDDADLAERLRQLRDHGLDSSGTHVVPGGTNARLGALQAAVVRAHLGYLDNRLKRRRQIAAQLDEIVGAVAIPRDDGGPVSVYALRHQERDRLARDLATAGIETRVYYPVPVHAQPALAGRVRIPAPTPHADRFCAEVLALPCHADLTADQVRHLCGVLEVNL